VPALKDFEASFTPRSHSLIGEALFHCFPISFLSGLHFGTSLTLLGHAQFMTFGVVVPFQVRATLLTEPIILSAFVAGYKASCYDPTDGSAT
jgi:hypothetical protein